MLAQDPQASRQPSSTNAPWGSPRGNSLENPNHNRVINLSSKPLTQVQRSVLAKAPNFAVTPRHPLNLEYITAIEAACIKLGRQDAEINRGQRSSHPQTELNQSSIKCYKGTKKGQGLHSLNSKQRGSHGHNR